MRELILKGFIRRVWSRNEWEVMMVSKAQVPKDGQQRQLKVLCIDSHASSTFSLYLLTRCGYKVDCASFLCDAIELVHDSSYDVYLINDELARSGKELLEKFREAAGSIPIVYYSTVVYPFRPRLADQSGSTPDTPAPVTEAAIAVARALSHVRSGEIASTCAA
jgi:hypothetical protein